MLKKTIKFFLLPVVIIYFLIAFYLYSSQRDLLYNPTLTTPTFEEHNAQNLTKIVQTKTSDNLTLSGWVFDTVNAPLIILYFHGNARSHGDRTPDAKRFNSYGYPIILAGYRGFSGNPGKISEQGLYEDARSWIEWTKQSYPNHKIVLYGESLGTGIVSKMATEYSVAGVILEVPYTSITDVAKDRYPIFPVELLLIDKYDTKSRIRDVNVPILIFGAGQDKIVPPHHSKKLYNMANEPKTLYFEPNAGHLNIFNFKAEKYTRQFLKDLH